MIRPWRRRVAFLAARIRIVYNRVMPQVPESRKSINKMIDQTLADLYQLLRKAVRQEVQDDLVAFLRGLPAPAARPASETDAKTGKTRKKTAARKAAKPAKIVTCRAPGCTKPAKGPRYHFLCEDHRTAPAEQIAAWQAGKREPEAHASAPAPAAEDAKLAKAAKVTRKARKKKA